MKEDGGEEVEEGGEGRGERGRVAKVTKDPQVRTLQQFVRAETEKSQATPAQKSQVTPDRSHKRPLYRGRSPKSTAQAIGPGGQTYVVVHVGVGRVGVPRCGRAGLFEN